MLCKSAAVLVVATTVLARTPNGFSPPSNTDLIVEYRGFAPQNGVVVARDITISEPKIGTLTRLNGTSYAVLMIDLDIPTDSPPATNTLLHWMQTGLTPASTPTQLNTTAGTIRAFLLENGTNTAPIVAYFGPNPPARIPLSHRYTQILVDTSEITDEGTQALRTAAGTLRGFNAQQVLAQANLGDKVVAGNFYNVTNPGPATTPSSTASGSGSAATGGTQFGTGSGSGAGTGIGAGTGGTNTSSDVVTADGILKRPGGALVGVLMVGAAMFAL
ncbi:putative phosphatidylethanolamine-binding protein pebp protein [Cladorrhinum sp. PSN259]|nr:putative phosphatidylethanolamine-binding protein pebp protein [Cladorrhinum sp. PSN259]